MKHLQNCKAAKLRSLGIKERNIPASALHYFKCRNYYFLIMLCKLIHLYIKNVNFHLISVFM